MATDTAALRQLCAELRERASKATPGEWVWPRMFNGSTLWANKGMRPIVLDAVRHGMNSACLRFRDHEKCLMVKAVDLPGDQSHPDKDWIAYSCPANILRLVEMVEAVCDENERLRQPGVGSIRRRASLRIADKKAEADDAQ